MKNGLVEIVHCVCCKTNVIPKQKNKKYCKTCRKYIELIYRKGYIAGLKNAKKQR